MKEDRIQHILIDNNTERKPRILKFTHFIHPITGVKVESNFGTNHFDNVKKINMNLYLAWDNGAEEQATVYVGEFINQ